MRDELRRFYFPISHLVPKIFRLHEHWTKRDDKLPFWTFGRASYKDFHLPGYHECAEGTNRILYDAFPDFYDNQLKFFEGLLGAPVKYMPGISLPGFHIFLSCEAFTKPLARPHVDIPFDNFEWGETVDMSEIFTHVIPVQLPKAGGGMRVWWDRGVEDIAARGVDQVLAELKDLPYEIVDHKVDHMLMHSGKFFHQIAPFKEHERGAWRITLQSHAIKRDGVWYLYW